MKPFVAALDEELVRLHPIARQNELPSFGNKLMVEAAIVTVALHQALRRLDVDADCSRELVADSIWSIYRKSLWLASLPARLLTSDPGRRLRWTIRTLLRFPFNAPGEPGYAVEARIEGEDILTHFTHCPPQTFARRVADETGDPEALRVFRDSWCLYDWPGADLIAGDGNRGHYRRPHTLSHGDPVCDMCWAARASEKPDG